MIFDHIVCYARFDDIQTTVFLYRIQNKPLSRFDLLCELYRAIYDNIPENKIFYQNCDATNRLQIPPHIAHTSILPV
jgi:hypothetical protein